MGAKELAVKISKYLSNKNFKPITYNYNGYNGLYVERELLETDFDFVISLGGDGNVLFASRLAAPKKIPVVPINFGQFGFIANIEPKDWQVSLDNFLAGKEDAHFRMLLEIQLIRQGKCLAKYSALNDAVISGYGVPKLTTVELFYNKNPLGKFRADGVIVSTPTGSTGYAVASGGPILDPSMSAFVVSPVAPFTLSNRPIVLPATGMISLKVVPQRQKKFILSVDGQESKNLEIYDEVVIRQSENKVNLIGCSQEHFYRVLRAKLGWSGSFSINEN